MMKGSHSVTAGTTLIRAARSRIQPGDESADSQSPGTTPQVPVVAKVRAIERWM